MLFIMIPKLSSDCLKNLRGYLPVYKPVGLLCNKLLRMVIADLNSVAKHSDFAANTKSISYFKELQPYADGVLTFFIGGFHRKPNRNALLSSHYRVVIEVGIERAYNCINGTILETHDIRHIDHEIVEKASRSLIGDIIEKRNNSVKTVEEQDLYKITNSTIIYNTFDTKDDPLDCVKEVKKQKYPLERQLRSSICYDVQFINYEMPYATLEIKCKGNLSIESLAEYFGRALGTKCSIVELTRTMEGPFSLKDIRLIQVDDLNAEYYVHRLPAIQKAYKSIDSQMYKFKRI